jgi:transposase
MATPVRVRPLSEQEDATLLRIVRGEGRQDTIRVRRAVMVRASAHGATPPLIARLLDADPDTVRDVIHAFNANGLAALDPHWGPGRPRRITVEDEEWIVRVATTRPRVVGRPFTHWSLRKLADYLTTNRTHPVVVHRERLREILHAHGISFPAHPDLEGVHRPRRGRQAGPDRAGARQVA